MATPFYKMAEDCDAAEAVTPACDFAVFLTKMDYEGGLWSLIQYGGPDQFPKSLRALAADFEAAGKRLHKAINQQAAEFGIEP